MFPELTFHCDVRWLWKFNARLQKGVLVKCITNRSLMALLMEDFHLDSAYISQRLQTITLDGRPVDDPADTTVRDRSTLAISGAMPGLVGATLRKGGYYAAMRGTISYTHTDQTNIEAQPGLVTLKLFNLILKDLAADFLARGIGVPGNALVPLIDELLTLSADQSAQVALDGQTLEWPLVRDSYLNRALVFVTVNGDKIAG